MKYRITHHSRNRLHMDLAKRRLTQDEADVLYYALSEREDVISVSVYPRTAQVTLRYNGSPYKVLDYIGHMSLKDEELKELVPSVSSRASNQYYKEKIIEKCVERVIKRLCLPLPVRTALTIYDSAPFIWHGIKDLVHREFSAEIVHASAIGASLLTGDFSTASSIAFLTDMGELLEEWTYKKSLNDLAESLSLHVSKVWKLADDSCIEQVNINKVVTGDIIQITMGNVIPLDGVVYKGEAMVNQATLTGESLPVHKGEGVSVFAGTVVEDGELLIEVKQTSGETRYDNIVRMIEESESLVSIQQSQAERVVSKLIPYTFGTAVLTYLFTRNFTKAASVLMVDFSCAIEVAMPIAVLSAMKEAGKHRITVKGGRYLEEIAQADTIVFDKTGTLTKATPTVAEITVAQGLDPDEMLRIAACIEEHFPHSLANAVVREAKNRGLDHEEMHSKATYIVAHGIATSIGEDRAVIGSYHFIFEDEGVTIAPGDEHMLTDIPEEHSHLYMAIGGKLVAIIGIADPIKETTPAVIRELKALGINNIVMMTGDSERTAASIAAKAGIDHFYAEVLPEDKAHYVEKEKNEGHKVIMVGDGINDSPALSAADVGIAMKEGADIAQQIADVTLYGNDLEQLIRLRSMSTKLQNRMTSTAKGGIAFNAGILVAGLLGMVIPGTAAFLHNASTITLCLRNMNDLIPSEIDYEPFDESAYQLMNKGA